MHPKPSFMNKPDASRPHIKHLLLSFTRHLSDSRHYGMEICPGFHQKLIHVWALLFHTMHVKYWHIKMHDMHHEKSELWTEKANFYILCFVSCCWFYMVSISQNICIEIQTHIWSTKQILVWTISVFVKLVEFTQLDAALWTKQSKRTKAKKKKNAGCCAMSCFLACQ